MRFLECGTVGLAQSLYRPWLDLNRSWSIFRGLLKLLRYENVVPTRITKNLHTWLLENHILLWGLLIKVVLYRTMFWGNIVSDSYSKIYLGRCIPRWTHESNVLFLARLHANLAFQQWWKASRLYILLCFRYSDPSWEELKSRSTNSDDLYLTSVVVNEMTTNLIDVLAWRWSIKCLVLTTTVRVWQVLLEWMAISLPTQTFPRY